MHILFLQNLDRHEAKQTYGTFHLFLVGARLSGKNVDRVGCHSIGAQREGGHKDNMKHDIVMSLSLPTKLMAGVVVV
jgi:hypothetical protein